ncbi:hypothetical protein PV405_34895, partial [Streptomyces sp. ME02-6979-3A]|uniref:hypothetical protein n=1 Tax=Streptomyces sp. ME02-6979-3A TaxID=3028673 RepID=UPI0029B223F3
LSFTPPLSQIGTPMSPYLSTVTNLFSGDLATISTEIKKLREDILIADIDLAHQEAEGIAPEEIVTRYVEARGIYGIQKWLRDLAAEYDAAQPFGLRLIDELDTLDALSFSAAA